MRSSRERVSIEKGSMGMSPRTCWLEHFWRKQEREIGTCEGNWEEGASKEAKRLENCTAGKKSQKIISRRREWSTMWNISDRSNKIRN